MPPRKYYSTRVGTNPLARLDLGGFKMMFLSVERSLWAKGHMAGAFGYSCPDAGDVPGTLGADLEGAVLIAIRKENLWPIYTQIDNYKEDDLFDIIEFLYDHVSKPQKSWVHDYGGCGNHYSDFDKEAGQAEYVEKLNPILQTYRNGYELNDKGEILTLPPPGMGPLLDAPLPTLNPNNVEAKVRAAADRFRRHNSSLDERKNAIRDLADVLEFLRDDAKDVLSSKDEGDLFNIANNFGIRHHNVKQKTNYDAAIWYSWMFYHYLSTIHVCLRLIARKKAAEAKQKQRK